MLKEGFALHQQGRFAEAERLYAAVLKTQPGNVQALHLMGVLAQQMGQPERAVELLQAATRIESRLPMVQRDLGNALQALGRNADALACFDKALAFKPDMADAYNGRGAMLAALGREGDALTAYSQAIALKPDYAAAYNNRAVLLAGMEHAEEAIEDFGRAIARDANYSRAILGRAHVLLVAGRANEALADFDRALVLMPMLAAGHDERGTALSVLGRSAEALESHDRALALEPNFATAHDNRGAALAALGRLDEALAAHEWALALDANSAMAHNNRGIVLGKLGRMDEALASHDRAIALAPGMAQQHVNRGHLLTELKQQQEALNSFDRALDIAPQLAEAQFGKSQVLLREGRFAEGWTCYEGRKRRPGLVFSSHGRPSWTGAEDIACKTLYIESEQGLGDTIQFCRYAAMAAARGARVIVAVQEKLVRLVKSLDAPVEVQAAGGVPPDFDYHIFLLSQPMAFATHGKNIPAVIPYLHAEPALVEKWRARIGDEGFRIGISWQGASSNISRSFDLSLFEALAAVPGVRLYSLQKGGGTEQLEKSGVKIEILGDDFDAGPDAFVDTAAVMASMDLIITPDTSIAHLAGALGRPVWVALKYSPDWRWGLEGETSDWYPGMRLFRQPVMGDWKSVFGAMTKALAAITKGKG